VRDARLWDGLWERHAYERRAYGMALVRGTPMRWPIGDARVWEIHAYEMALVRNTLMRDPPVRDAPMGWPPMRDTPMRRSMGDARL
jgi:hypothetical protein